MAPATHVDVALAGDAHLNKHGERVSMTRAPSNTIEKVPTNLVYILAQPILPTQNSTDAVTVSANFTVVAAGAFRALRDRQPAADGARGEARRAASRGPRGARHGVDVRRDAVSGRPGTADRVVGLAPRASPVL